MAAEFDKCKCLDAYFEIASVYDGTPSSSYMFQNKLLDLFQSIHDKGFEIGFQSAIDVSLEEE